jgi:hypothetical protein
MSGRASRNKGIRGETELVEILDELGLPSIRVLGSGAFTGAKSDVKVGIELNDDGSKPEADEAKGIMRIECKNRKDNPEYLFENLGELPINLVLCPRQGSEKVWEHYNQDSISKAVALRRRAIPRGAKVGKEYNQMWLICMGIEDYVKLVKQANKK